MTGFATSPSSRSVLLVGASLAAMVTATPAWAQDAAPQSTDQAEAAQPAPAPSTTNNAPQSGDIVVTGSRLKTVTQFNSPDPISIVSPDIAKKEGKFDLATTLQSSPVAAGSTQITAALSSNFVTNGGPGAETIDLRGLGANRTLVLLNGRRAGPAGTRGGVSSFDLNVLPLSIINDIQILKTGASSVYGSDAIAGVVNIITDSKLDGLRLDANGSMPFTSGGEEYRISAAWGKKFDRGNFMIAVDYTHKNELARGDRDYLACPQAYTFREDGSRADLIDPRTGQPHCEDLRWGHVWTYNLIDNLHLDGPGGAVDGGINTSIGGRSVLLQYNYPSGPGAGPLNIPPYGTPGYPGDFGAPAGWFPTGYDAASMAVQNAYHPFVEEQTIIPKTDLFTLYSQGAYQVSDSVELFGEFLFNRRKTYQNGWRQFWNFGWTGDLYGYDPGGNSYNYWGGGFTGVNFISPTGITNHADTSQKVDYYRGVGGLRGDVGSGGKWHYEAFVQYSKSVGKYRTEQLLQDVYDAGSFQYSSCVGRTLPVSGKACMDLPWADPYFLRGEMTPDQVDYMFDWEEGRTDYTQLTGEASINGELLQMPAGPLAVALGVSVRQDRIYDKPGEITLAGNAWGNTASGITAGKSVTKEIFGEANVPIFRDMTFAKELSLSAAARLTGVTATRKSDGVSASDKGNWTYKLGLNWRVNDWIRFRGSLGTSYRAPALFEQFLADETGFVSQRIDVCSGYVGALAAGSITQRTADNCAADGIPANYQAGAITLTTFATGGLGNLKAETSRAKTAGFVLTPRIGNNTKLSLAVDWFDIRVKGEISQLGAGTIVAGCYDSENFATEPLCALITRNRTAGSSTEFQITGVRDPFINISEQHNSGVDVSGRIDQQLGSLGRLSFMADMTWQLTDTTRLLPTSPLRDDNGRVGSPKWVGDFRLNWIHPSGLSIFYGVNVIGKANDTKDLARRNQGDVCLNSYNPDGNVPIYGTYCPVLKVPRVLYHNISATKEFSNGRFSITAGVSNLFDKKPPRVSVLNGGQIGMLGPVVAASQYGFIGRKGFINLSVKY